MMTQGIREAKAFRRTLMAQLRQVDGIIDGFKGLAASRSRGAQNDSKPSTTRKPAKRAGNGRKRARKPTPEASLAAAAQD